METKTKTAEESLAIYYDSGSVIIIDSESSGKNAIITLDQINIFSKKYPDRSIYLTMAIKSRTSPWYRKLRKIDLIEMLKIKKSNMIHHLYASEL